MTGDALLNFVNTDLFPTLKGLPVLDRAGDPSVVVRGVFEDAYNYMKSGTLLRQVINRINEIDFNRSQDRHLFNDIYEQILRDLQSAGNAGEYYTPRAVTQFMVEMTDPKLGDEILDPACGTGGFLVNTIEHIRSRYVNNPEQEAELQRSIHGVEKKPLPHLLCTTNLLLHGLDVPTQVRRDNTLARPLRDYGPRDRVEVILTNPPFGGEEEQGIESNFPAQFQTRETADLFLVLLMHLLKEDGRAALVLPDGFLNGGIRTMTGTAGQQRVSKDYFVQAPFPLPPLTEQRRIVEKVDQLMALCDELEGRQQRRAEARVRLNRASLHHLTAATDAAELAEQWQRIRDNFPLLYNAPETVTELRQAILQLAVRGNLVPFDADSATRPFETILAEPSLNGIATKPHDEPIGTPVLRISAGTSRRDALVDELDHKYLEVDPATVEKYRLNPGDLLACRFNGNLHYVGRLSLYSGYTGQAHIYPDKLIRFRVDHEKADPAYIRYAFNAADTRQRIEAFCATTAGNIGISAGRLKTIEIPVPPLRDQRRIVEKVDQLMALCDEIEAKLTRSRTKAERLASAVVHHLTAA